MIQKQININISFSRVKFIFLEQISAIFYEEGKAIGYRDTYVDCKETNSSDFINIGYLTDDDYNYIVSVIYQLYKISLYN